MTTDILALDRLAKAFTPHRSNQTDTLPRPGSALDNRRGARII